MTHPVIPQKLPLKTTQIKMSFIATIQGDIQILSGYNYERQIIIYLNRHKNLIELVKNALRIL